MFVLRSMLLVILVNVNMISCSPKCPPGGTYFDKHVGQYGRMECCSELCQSGFFSAECSKKCPDYNKVKSIEDTDGTAGTGESDLKSRNLDKAISLEPPTNTLLYTLLTVAAVVVVVVVVVVVAVLAKRRGWSNIFTSLTRTGQVKGQRPATNTMEMGNQDHQDHDNNQRGWIQDEDSQGLLEQQGQGQGSDGRRQGDVGRSIGGLPDGAMANGRLPVNAANGGLPMNAANGGLPLNVANGGLSVHAVNGGLPVDVTEETAAKSTPVDCSEFQTASEEGRYRAPIQARTTT